MYHVQTLGTFVIFVSNWIVLIQYAAYVSPTFWNKYTPRKVLDSWIKGYCHCFLCFAIVILCHSRSTTLLFALSDYSLLFQFTASSMLQNKQCLTKSGDPLWICILHSKLISKLNNTQKVKLALFGSRWNHRIWGSQCVCRSSTIRANELIKAEQTLL